MDHRIASAAEFGARVRALRKAQGMTQVELATVCATSARFIGELERGKTTCQLGKALHVLRLLGGDLRVMGDDAGA